MKYRKDANMRRYISVPLRFIIPRMKVTMTESIEPTHASMKSGWLFWMIPSMCLNAKRYAVSLSFAIPGITTIANPNKSPATNEHNKMDDISANWKRSMVGAKPVS